jgi:N-acetylmuramoyl-L-alanine amidase
MDGDIELHDSCGSMGRSPLALAVALALIAPAGVASAATSRAAAGRRTATPTLEDARAELAALVRDPSRRRLRHNWERVIAGLLRAAKGKDAPAATLEAARARHALYRWSSNGEDRRKALLLADRATRLGSREAPALARELRAGTTVGAGSAKRASQPPAKPASAVENAKGAMTALMRDPQKRRYRHNWERGISGLLRAAKGRDAAPATLEAARARYALYRWSANEGDRDKAVVLADRAARMGSREAPALARAIRREAGEDRPAPRAPARAPPVPEPEEDPPADPALEHALADLSAADTAPALPLGTSDGAGAARVSEVRTWSSDDYSRVAVYLSHWVGWQKIELPAGADGPRRIALDLRPAVLDGAARAMAVPGAQVDRVRVAQNDPETVRVVLDLPGADRVELFALDDPPRLVLDVGTHPASSAPPAVAATGPAREDAPVAAPRAARAGDEADVGRSVRRVVVDAGHGGHDPGAIGPRRVREKDVTLAIARRVARRLRDRGFEVVLTRSDDRYLALEERTAIANTARGDLFVSIHANAHPQRRRSGVETYVLDVAHDRYAARLAARENGLDLGGTREVTRILADLDAKASAGPSGRLAQLVQREVTTGIRAHVGEVRDIGVKSALFYVLLGARMPAVLVETGFISNRAEERRLASARYQDEVAAGITRAVAAFARSEERVAAAR